MQRAVIEVKRNAVGHYYFVMKDGVGKTLVVSSSFMNRAQLESRVAQMREKASVARVTDAFENAIGSPVFLITKGCDGYTFSLLGFAGETVFSSESYSEKSECIENIQVLKELALDARIVDLA